MALIKCSECGIQISDKAVACVHCGNPINLEEPSVERYGPSGEKLANAPGDPQRVTTSEDSVLARNRGCADLLLIPFVILAAILLTAMLFGSL